VILQTPGFITPQRRHRSSDLPPNILVSDDASRRSWTSGSRSSRQVFDRRSAARCRMAPGVEAGTASIRRADLYAPA
jgi:hypothetical protein